MDREQNAFACLRGPRGPQVNPAHGRRCVASSGWHPLERSLPIACGCALHSPAHAGTGYFIWTSHVTGACTHRVSRRRRKSPKTAAFACVARQRVPTAYRTCRVSLCRLEPEPGLGVLRGLDGGEDVDGPRQPHAQQHVVPLAVHVHPTRQRLIPIHSGQVCVHVFANTRASRTVALCLEQPLARASRVPPPSPGLAPVAQVRAVCEKAHPAAIRLAADRRVAAMPQLSAAAQRVLARHVVAPGAALALFIACVCRDDHEG